MISLEWLFLPSVRVFCTSKISQLHRNPIHHYEMDASYIQYTEQTVYVSEKGIQVSQNWVDGLSVDFQRWFYEAK